MNKLQLILFLQAIAIGYSLNSPGLEMTREWKQLDFVFPNASARANAIHHKHFVPENVFPIDIDIDHPGDRLFITTPRFSEGVPVVLGYINSPKTSMAIQPYPDYSWHSSHGRNCDGMTSVLRIAIDECRRLWILDTGMIGGERKCPPQLLLFKLANDQLVKRYKFPVSQYTDQSLFITPVLDVEDPPPFGSCARARVYIADVTGFALIVYDSVTNKSWKVQNKLFYPYPNYGTFTIAGESFDLMDGLFGLTLSRAPLKDLNSNAVSGTFNRQSERSLYFHALASGHENVVSCSVLNNASIWESDANSFPRAFKTIGTRGIQTSAQAMDSNGNMWFVLINPVALACWDSSLPYSADNIKVVVENNETLQFASGLKIIKNLAHEEEIWIITNRFQKIATGSLNHDEVNFRILYRSIRALLKGNPKCNGQQISAGFVFPS